MSLTAIAVELTIGAAAAGRRRWRESWAARREWWVRHVPIDVTSHKATGMTDGGNGIRAWFRLAVAPVVEWDGRIAPDAPRRTVGASVIVNDRALAVHRRPADADRASLDATLDELELEAKWEKS